MNLRRKVERFIALPIWIHSIINLIIIALMFAVGYPMVKYFPHVSGWIYVAALAVFLAAVIYIGLTEGDPRLNGENLDEKEYYVKDLFRSFIRLCWSMPDWADRLVTFVLGLIMAGYGIYLAFYLKPSDRRWWQIAIFAGIFVLIVSFRAFMDARKELEHNLKDESRTTDNLRELDTPPRLRNPNRDMQREMALDVPEHPHGEDYLDRPAFERRGIKVDDLGRITKVDPSFIARGGSWYKK